MNAPNEITLDGHATPDQVWTYLHLPFAVPENVSRIDVRYEYSDQIGSDPHLTDGNTVDIGIFDPRGIEFNTNGFRGWTGSARQELYLGHDEATPGYMPGPIQAGTWHICLGLYKIQAAGCDYRVTIKLTVSETASEINFPKLLPLRDGESPATVDRAGWYRGEIHCHTINSDGDSTCEEVVRRAEALGLDFLAITDHNNMTQLISLRTIETSLMLIPGVEVTTYNGHWNVWGDQGWLDFRITSEDEMRRCMLEAEERGYLVSCNHPRPYGPDWNFPAVDTFDCVEVWNGPWQLANDVCLAFWERHLRAGKRYTAVGGSDSHFLKREHHAKLGHPTNYVYCEGNPSPAKILANMRAGHSFISESPDGAQVYFSVNHTMVGNTLRLQQGEPVITTVRAMNAQGNTLQLIGADGVVEEFAIGSDEWNGRCQVNVRRSPYLRAQIVDQQAHVKALTNPIYFEFHT